MKKRKIPMRKCLITNQQFEKKELTRIVMNKDEGLKVDLTSKLNGRGAYIKLSLENVDLAQKRRVFEREFSVDDASAIYDELRGIANE